MTRATKLGTAGAAANPQEHWCRHGWVVVHPVRRCVASEHRARRPQVPLGRCRCVGRVRTHPGDRAPCRHQWFRGFAVGHRTPPLVVALPFAPGGRSSKEW